MRFVENVWFKGAERSLRSPCWLSGDAFLFISYENHIMVQMNHEKAAELWVVTPPTSPPRLQKESQTYNLVVSDP